MQIGGFTPDDPAHAGIHQSVFVAGGVDGFHARQLEIPEQVRLDERGHETAARAVDVDRNIKARFLLQPVERGAQSADTLVLACEGAAQHADHADGVLIAGRRGAFRIGDILVAFERDRPLFDIPVAKEFVPADLRVGAEHQVRPIRRLSELAHLLAPAPLQRQAAQHARFARSDGGSA